MRDYFEQNIVCPHCGHHTRIVVDASEGDQDYYEDCLACCNSIHITVIRHEQTGDIEVRADADDEQYF
ncbi:CPXCG motif-containing cysteine-rich protein [Zobellella taiwanensis]|jgi:transcription elongation factor Elf1|uniref:CPXCG motif-containing cysteine-rich protein n=1 Tax=Zobellella taiwanensis TaxID=347535 RepID=A0A2P7RA57_9GAMM|nr:CPXCG motif-containing cysteine-rich protein [Zobellella taiwanensis]PSJ47106.1 CPXCG motif-containing cysteine-rich protein [Zobellella taiwanensis]